MLQNAIPVERKACSHDANAFLSRLEHFRIAPIETSRPKKVGYPR